MGSQPRGGKKKKKKKPSGEGPSTGARVTLTSTIVPDGERTAARRCQEGMPEVSKALQKVRY